MAFRRPSSSLLDDEFGDPFSSRRLGETSLVPYGRDMDLSLTTRRPGGSPLDRYPSDDFFDSPSPFGRDRGFSMPATRETDYRASSRDDMYYSSTTSRSPAYSPSVSSSMQVQLSTTSEEEDSSSLRVRRQQVSLPPAETSSYTTYATAEASGGGYRETYKPGRRRLRSLGRRKPELTSREEFTFTASSKESGGGDAGYGGGTYTSVTSEYDASSRDRYRSSYSRH